MIKLAARLVLTLLVIVVTGGPLAPANAQGAASPPTILTFESSLTAVSLADAETRALATTLRWETLGMRAADRLTVMAYQANAWMPLSMPGQPLPATGSVEVQVAHPHTFGPPTYKLVLQDAQGRTLDERTLMIPYADHEGPDGSIVSLSTSDASLNANDLVTGAARLTIRWEVDHRQPLTNLAFEQVLPDGSTVNVELPRQSLWIPSAGEGQLAPILPPGGGPIVIQLRLVELPTGVTLDTRQLPSLPVTDAAAVRPPASPPGTTASGASAAITTSPGPASAGSGASAPDGQGGFAAPAALRIESFTVTPNNIARGGPVTLSWQVTGASELSVWRLAPSGDLAEAAPDPTPTGSWTLTLDPAYTTGAGFVLFASDSAGRQAQRSVSVRIQCGMPYFFGFDSQGGCPAGDAITVWGAYQPFQGGLMLSRSDTSEVFVLYGSGQLGHYRDSWRGGHIAINDPAPPNTIPPQRAFGKVWTENEVVQIKLGWATAPEIGYTMRLQPALSGRIYVTLPNGNVIFLADSAWDFERRIN